MRLVSFATLCLCLCLSLTSFSVQRRRSQPAASVRPSVCLSVCLCVCVTMASVSTALVLFSALLVSAVLAQSGDGAPPLPNGDVPDVEGSGRAAVPVVGPGCSADTDCGDHQVCEQNSCRCQANYTIVNNNCVRAALFVGDACDYNEQCTFSLGGRSSCKMSRCVCDEGNIPANNRTACLLLKGLLESCVVSEQCKTNYSSCITSVCSCKANYVNDDTRACLPIVHKFEETCSIPTQCHNGKLGPGSQCAKTGPDEGKCICLSSYHYNQSKKKCLLTRGHGEECDNENTGCYLPLDEEKQGIECKNKKCQCKKKHVLSEDKQHCNSAFTQHGSFLVILLSAILSRRW